MIAGLCRAIFLERRRLSFVAAMAFLAGVLFYGNHPGNIGGIPVPYVVGAIYLVAITTFAAIVCIAIPRFRFLVEAIAVSRVVVAGGAFFFPSFGDVILASPLLNAVIVVGFGVAFSRLMHGKIKPQAMPRLRERLRSLTEPTRTPAVVVASSRQRKYVHWMDDARPIAG